MNFYAVEMELKTRAEKSMKFNFKVVERKETHCKFIISLHIESMKKKFLQCIQSISSIIHQRMKLSSCNFCSCHRKKALDEEKYFRFKERARLDMASAVFEE